MGIAQTGTGKTLAFGVPMIQRLAKSGGQSRGLIIAPTRELALQINETLKKIGSSLGLKTAILIGGEAMGKQLKALRASPHIIIATPGRLIDHLENSKLDISQTGILVLDEADRMLDMGFAPQIRKILQRVPKTRQTMLFSATMPDEIVNIAKSYMSLPLRVEVAPAGTAVAAISQELFFIDKADKPLLLSNILGKYKGSVLVFSRTKHGAKKIALTIRNGGETAAEIHSNRSLNQRLEALQGFKSGRYRILVATDIAARGIDVVGIELVVNYDLPDNAEDYVHRIGRTGRAGQTGHAISFATPDQRGDVRSIERLIKKALPVSQTGIAAGARRPQSFVREPEFREFRQRGPQRGGKPPFRKPWQSPERERSDRPQHAGVSHHSSTHSHSAGGHQSGRRNSGGKKFRSDFKRRDQGPKLAKGTPQDAEGYFFKRAKPYSDD